MGKEETEGIEECSGSLSLWKWFYLFQTVTTIGAWTVLIVAIIISFIKEYCSVKKG